MYFLEWDILISIKILLKVIPRGPINNIPALVQIMAWHRSIIYTYDEYFTDAHMRHTAPMN